MLITLKRIFKSGWQNFTRDGGIAAATCFVLVITIFLVSTIFLLKDVGQFLIMNLEEKADISIYFKDGVEEEEILAVKEKVSKIPEVKEVTYISKETALEEFIKRHKDDSVLMESLWEVGGNPFLASLSIQAWQAGQYSAITDFLGNPDFQNLVEKIDYYQRKEIIEKIFSLSTLFNKVSLGLSIILIITAILVTFNTVRLAILNSSEEIKIQRLVGASNGFIRGPFLVQGLIAGLISGLISLIIFSFTSWFLSPKIEFFFAGLNIFNLFMKNLGIIVLLQIFTGIFLAVISSTIAIRKYLRV